MRLDPSPCCSEGVAGALFSKLTMVHLDWQGQPAFPLYEDEEYLRDRGYPSEVGQDSPLSRTRASGLARASGGISSNEHASFGINLLSRPCFAPFSVKDVCYA